MRWLIRRIIWRLVIALYDSIIGTGRRAIVIYRYNTLSLRIYHLVNILLLYNLVLELTDAVIAWTCIRDCRTKLHCLRLSRNNHRTLIVRVIRRGTIIRIHMNDSNVRVTLRPWLQVQLKLLLLNHGRSSAILSVVVTYNICIGIDINPREIPDTVYCWVKVEVKITSYDFGSVYHRTRWLTLRTNAVV